LQQLEIGQTGRIFFSAEDYTNMSYYNCCGISPKYSNISKRVGEGVIAICVVLDQSTVIFQKGAYSQQIYLQTNTNILS
jgi:hypothetical protein